MRHTRPTVRAEGRICAALAFIITIKVKRPGSLTAPPVQAILIEQRRH